MDEEGEREAGRNWRGGGRSRREWGVEEGRGEGEEEEELWSASMEFLGGP